MGKKLDQKVVVITGASSGIGRATALTLAGKGATLVLAARREHALRELAAECESLGARTLDVALDVTDQEAVNNLARTAVERFGRIDVWVNNAAVAMFAPFERTPSEAFRRVIETNLFGYVYGAWAVMPIFRAQGSGVLINIGSIDSRVSQPYTSAYTMSKHAVAGLGEVLRQELLLEGQKDIHVCTVMPPTIDTPLFQHAANYSGRAVKAMPPVYPAQEVADTIVSLIKHPEPEVAVGSAGKMITMQARMSRQAVEMQLAKMTDAQQFADDPAPDSEGNLFEPMPDYTGVSGGWKGEERSKARKLLALGAVGATAAGGWLWVRSRRQ